MTTVRVRQGVHRLESQSSEERGQRQVKGSTTGHDGQPDGPHAFGGEDGGGAQGLSDGHTAVKSHGQQHG